MKSAGMGGSDWRWCIRCNTERHDWQAAGGPTHQDQAKPATKTQIRTRAAMAAPLAMVPSDLKDRASTMAVAICGDAGAPQAGSHVSMCRRMNGHKRKRWIDE